MNLNRRDVDDARLAARFSMREFVERVCPRDVVARSVDEARGTCVVETRSTGSARTAASVSRARAAATERERRARVARALGVRIRVVDDLVRAVREEIGRALDVGAEPPPRSHPNVATARCVVFDAAGTMVVSVEPMSEYTLGSCLRLGSDALRSPARKSLAAYQACRALAHVHEKNLAHGNLSADSVRLSSLSGGPVGVPYVQLGGMFDSSHVRDGSAGDAGSRRVEVSEESARRLRDGAEPSVRSLTAAWRIGAVSNLEYVLKLNDIAHRGSDLAYYRVAPWVIDFTAFPLREDGSLRGARDLTKTKWRLTKGDEQLDFTYRHTTPPHHVSDDCLSELGACVALARRTPRSTLARIVRANVVAEEYPKDLERLYETSPDEAPIDFYTDPRVFSSIHEDMDDLGVPSWCAIDGDAVAHFIKIHREAFESRVVSERLHAWIDLTFGHATCGKAAVEAKNVMVRDDVEGMMRSSGRCRIFHAPHPKRRVGVVPRSVPNVEIDRDADDASTAEALRTTTIVEPAFRFVQERDLRALGRIIGAIYTGVPCPEDREAAAGGLFDDASISNSLFDRRRESEDANASIKAWLARMPNEARDVVKLLMDVTKPIAAAAVRDSVLFSQDIRNAALVLGKMRAVRDSRAAKIMIAEDALTGASATTARLVLEDVCPAIAAYVSAPLDQTEEMRVAMCLARFVETACAVASRRDVSEMILPLVVSAVNAPSAHLATEGPTPKRELFELATVKAMRKAVGAARFDDVFVPILIKCLQPKFCNADELNRVKDALVHVATSMPLPVVRQRVINVLRRALRNNRADTSSGAHVLIADVLSLLARALGPASEEFIFRATIAPPPSVLDHLDDWHRRADAEPVESREWYWLSRASRDEDEHERDDASTMSQVLANASNVTDDPWRVHVEELVSWRAHSRVARRCAQSFGVSVDERLFMTAGRTSRGEGTVRIWRASGPEDDTDRASVSYDGHGSARVTASAFLDFATDADGFVSRACSCDDRGTLQVWDTRRGDHVWRFALARDSNGFESLCVDDGVRGPFVVGGTARGRVVIADAVAGKARGEYSSPRDVSADGGADDDGVRALHSAADGIVWASDARGNMRGFDVRAKRGRPVYDVKAHDDAVNKIVSTPAGARELLTASDDMTIGLWDVRAMSAERDSRKRFDARLRTFRGHQKGVKDACVSAEGDVFSVSGCSVGVFSLASSGANHFARFSPLSVHGVTTRLLPMSMHEQASFGAIRLLPKSRLFALLNDDGAVSVCH